MDEHELLNSIVRSDASLGAFSGMIFNALVKQYEGTPLTTENLISLALGVRLKIIDLAAKIPEEDPTPSNPVMAAAHLNTKGREGGYPAVCSLCKANCNLPFKPKFQNAVYCENCYKKKKESGTL